MPRPARQALPITYPKDIIGPINGIQSEGSMNPIVISDRDQIEAIIRGIREQRNIPIQVIRRS